MWLAGLHAPETYIAALVQTACRTRGWPLDRASLTTAVTRFSDAAAVKTKPALGCYIQACPASSPPPPPTPLLPHIRLSNFIAVSTCLSAADAVMAASGCEIHIPRPPPPPPPPPHRPFPTHLHCCHTCSSRWCLFSMNC